MKYLVLHFRINPLSDVVRDVLSAMLAESGFESFEYTDQGIDAYIKTDNYLENNVTTIITDFFIPNVIIEYETCSVDDKNWNEEWEKNGFTPIIIDDLCVIHDSNHVNLPKLNYDIIINPKMSFGTGSHETTKMLIKEILMSDFNGQTVLDMGCGTCILGIGMSMKGANSVIAVDIDEGCIKNSMENCEMNRIENVVLIHGDSSSILNNNYFDTIIANIHKNILLRDMHNYVSMMKSGSVLYMSGFFIDDSKDIIIAAKEHGLELQKTIEMNNWCVLKFII